MTSTALVLYYWISDYFQNFPINSEKYKISNSQKTRRFYCFYTNRVFFFLILCRNTLMLWLSCIYGGRSVTRYLDVTDKIFRITAVLMASLLNLTLTETPDILSGPLWINLVINGGRNDPCRAGGSRSHCFDFIGLNDDKNSAHLTLLRAAAEF